jgi:hypothetical protein
MSSSIWTAEFMNPLRTWLADNLSSADLEQIIPPNDPLRIWWVPEPEALNVGALIDVVLGARDHLTLLALIQYVRTKAGADAFPKTLDLELTSRLVTSANEVRSSSRGGDFHAFFSYSHGDMDRARILLSVFQQAGLRIFHDITNLKPGDSIVGRLHEVMSGTSRAILLVTEHYMKSQWTQRELDFLLARSKSKEVLLLPILLDDIALRPDISDIFTVDLRGFRDESDRAWAESRLQRLIDQCLSPL